MIFKTGNAKLSVGVALNLPAGKTCPNCADCVKSCYALNAERQYATAKTSRQNTLNGVNDGSVWGKLQTKINNFSKRCEKKNISAVVRFHESGDIFAQSYLDSIFTFCSKNQNVKFYLYTKTLDLWNFEGKPDNLNVINSTAPDGLPNFGDLERVAMLVNKHKFFLCPLTNGMKDGRCGVHCTYCQDNQNVAFLVHGSGNKHINYYRHNVESDAENLIW